VFDGEEKHFSHFSMALSWQATSVVIRFEGPKGWTGNAQI